MSLKIMYFLDDGQEFGGAANTLLQQAILMKKAGYKILLSISNDKRESMSKKYSKICKENNMEILSLPFPIASQPEDIDIVSVIRNYSVVREAVREYFPDLLHSVQINPLVELISRELKIPHIMNIYQIHEQFFSINYINIFPHYHICDSWYYANIWMNLIQMNSTCIRTVANCPAQIRISEKDNHSVRYCCVGGMYARKNQLEVIKAFEMAKSEGLEGELFFYGYDTGAYAEKCKKYLKDNHLNEFIRIEGFCLNMDDIYEKSEVLLCGSTCESYPNVISEALAHGLVIISTPVAGVPEVIRDGYNGYICDGYSETAIYQKIRQYEQDRNSGKIEKIIFNANDTYKKTHSPKSVSSDLIKYYHYVLEDNHRIPEIKIESIRKKFSDIIKCYNNNCDIFIHPEIARLKIWYVYHIQDVLKRIIVENKKEIYIWGAGRLAQTIKSMVEIFFPFLEIRGFIDNYKRGELLGLAIYPSDEILKKSDNIIFVGIINGQEEVLEILQINSRIYNQDYFVLAPRVW